MRIEQTLKTEADIYYTFSKIVYVSGKQKAMETLASVIQRLNKNNIEFSFF